MKGDKITIIIKKTAPSKWAVLRRGYAPMDKTAVVRQPVALQPQPTPAPAPAVQRPSDRAIIYRGELDYVSRCILDYPDIETGGQLFGYWTASGDPVVVYAIGPGPRANHQVAFFNQDRNYLVQVGGELVERYGLQHIGEWHSHHRLGLAHPSGHDADTMVRSIAHGHLHRFLLCIGNCDERSSTLAAFNFTEDTRYDYVSASWYVREGESPLRATIDRELSHLLVHPRTTQARHGTLKTAQIATQSAVYAPHYWLKDHKNNAQLKAIIDNISRQIDVRECLPQLDDDGHVHLLVDRVMQREHIYFPQGFPQLPPTIATVPAGEPWPQATHVPSDDVAWDCRNDDDIADAFGRYYKQLITK